MASRVVVVALHLLAIASLVRAQEPSTRDQEILVVEHAMAQTWDAGDAGGLSKFIADDFRGTTQSGKVVGKQQLLTFVKNAAGGSSKYEDEAVWVDGNVGVYTVRVTDSWATRNGQHESAVTRVTDVWVRTESGWKLKFSQETLVRGK